MKVCFIGLIIGAELESENTFRSSKEAAIGSIWSIYIIWLLLLCQGALYDFRIIVKTRNVFAMEESFSIIDFISHRPFCVAQVHTKPHMIY